MNRPIQSIHFVGVGGTAMASTALALQTAGYRITGSDQNVYEPTASWLNERQLPVLTPYSEDNLQHDPDLVVIGNAVSRGNPEVEEVLERKLPFCSLPELLQRFWIQGRHSIVVAGTHGKTSISALLAWVLEHNGFHPSFLIGGIPENFGQGARFTESGYIILEGDEYDSAFFDKRSKFLHYLPEVAILNNLEFDHADIFPDLESIQRSFGQLVNLVPRNGYLIANGEAPHLKPLLADIPCPMLKYGLQTKNDLQATGLDLGPEGSSFEVDRFRFRIPQVGELNVRNALPVIACARHFGLHPEAIQSAFDTFQGVKRRMEVRGTVRGITVIDDFAHHPTAIQETLRALRLKFPHRRLWAIFEPRSNTTRRNVLQKDLGAALKLADRVIVAEVARLEQLAPEARLAPEELIQDLRVTGRPAVHLPSVEAILRHAVDHAAEGDVFCVLSNGGFGNIHSRLLAALRESQSEGED